VLQFIFLYRFFLQQYALEGIESCAVVLQQLTRSLQRLGKHVARFSLYCVDGSVACAAVCCDSLAEKRMLRVMIVVNSAETLAHAVVGYHLRSELGGLFQI